MTNNSLFILTGGPGSGKTTVLDELSRRGYPVLPEVARQLIQEQVRSGGNALPWGDQKRYAELMLERSIDAFVAEHAMSRTTFADRGIPDTLCHARLAGLSNQQPILEACTRYRYAMQVFLAPPWHEIFTTDKERKQDFAEALRTYDSLLRVYEECQYEVIELPRSTPAQRADFIVRHIPG